MQGNHEFDYNTSSSIDPVANSSFQPDWWNNGRQASRGECGIPLLRRHAGPANGNGVLWYSFAYGNVFVVQLSSEHDLSEGSVQHGWLVEQLGSVNRSVTPWVVVTLHRPIYTTQECETGDYVVSLHLRRHLDDIFLQHQACRTLGAARALTAAVQVNLALVAHTHAYERSCPLASGSCVEDGQGTVHITVGSAGAGLESGLADVAAFR